MQVFDLLADPIIEELKGDLVKVEKEKEKAGYNLFTISTYNPLLENFHSDIIGSLLSPQGQHDEGSVFLHLFIKYLRSLSSSVINLENYGNAEVLREKGRLDIWVRDRSSLHCIIIENKINGAFDRPGQIWDYHNHAIREGFIVDAIVYLSADGCKVAPREDLSLAEKILNIAAFNNTAQDLVNGWLLMCKEKCSNEDSLSFIHQYIKLLSHLSNKYMENQIIEKFYNFMSSNNAFGTIKEINNLVSSLPDYRAGIFSKQISDYLPFRHRFKYTTGYWIFEHFIEGENNYKLDVFFNKDSSANVVMWNTEKRNDDGYKTVEDKLKQIGLLDVFDGEPMYNGYNRHFILSKYSSIKDLDDAVLNFVKKIFKLLNNTLTQEKSA